MTARSACLANAAIANNARIYNMNDSMAQRAPALAPLDLPGWKTSLNWISAILTSLLFIVAGLWKMTDPYGAAARLAQARVPENLSLAAALLLGIAETVAAVLVLVPRFRKWGAWLGSALAGCVHDLHRRQLHRAARRGVQLLSRGSSARWDPDFS